ncbi:FtsX-like permease family protein [Kribbella italica]|uniref:Putative ABC transport system permease protein n=1 Tax=Kribbella italica TaxID=1540520 RepID=A0A7W9MVK5_9ACTN|nr:FtsX-like permease family protein [Kribbella italica]MBB5837078.1 putative ABC transport system permease protein [Kribbella italica]
MMKLAVRTLRFRKGGFVATFVAVVFGTAIVLACGGLMETGIRSNVPAERLATAEILVTGNQSHPRPGAEDPTPLRERVGVPAEAAAKLRAVDGVAEVIGDLSFATPVQTPNSFLQAEGHSWTSARLAPYKLVSGAAPTRATDVVLDSSSARSAGVRVGSRVTLLTNGEPSTYTVRGIANGPAGHTFFSSREATRLAATPGRFSSLGVLVAPGKDIATVRKAVEEVTETIAGGLTLHTGADRGHAEHPEASQSREALIAVAGSFGGIATITMMFVVASTLALSAQHREREFALLRSIGTTPGQVRRMILGESLLVSIPAVLIGLVPGVLLGRFLFDQLAENGVASPLLEFHQGWIPFAAGAGAAVLAAVGAALIAARKSARIKPVEALVEAGLQRKWFGWIRLLFGVLFLGGGTALVIVTGTVMSGPLAGATAGPAVLCWAIGVTLLGPFWTKLVLALVRWPLYAVSRVNGRLAIINVTARSVAMSAAVMPVMLAVGISTANIYMQTTQVHASEKAFTKELKADGVLGSVTGTGLPTSLLPAVREVPGVASASAYVTSYGAVDEPRNAPFDEDGAPLLGVSAQGKDGAAPVRVTAGSLEGLTGTTVAVPDRLVEKTGRGIGSTIKLTLGDGTPVELRVIATFAAESGYENLVLPAGLLAAHTTDRLVPQILVRYEPGANPVPALAKLADTHPGVQVSGREALIAGNSEELQTQAWVNYMLVGLLIGYTAVSVVNTLASSTIRRRREFALQRLTGSTRGQVLRMLTTESTLVVTAGVVLGTAVALATLIPFAAAVSGSGVPHGPWWIYLAIVAAAAGLTYLSTLIPATGVLRTSPAETTSRPD